MGFVAFLCGLLIAACNTALGVASIAAQKLSDFSVKLCKFCGLCVE